ncbi:dipeptide ABC transporter ATP-binding protein [Xylophilus sp.]|uniref:dipeptide ABC transporter ATP-binding protein n=1 Tax=Xylophilus sp. TaxID=2653893 RepID=UPI0013B80297|nr:ABC transporter ATP-binding protein [Xylophilus sp.]KAF1044563.1 MAG: Glutathione import ATP-binding protein GsiA [Xylophilus sp.]
MPETAFSIDRLVHRLRRKNQAGRSHDLPRTGPLVRVRNLQVSFDGQAERRTAVGGVSFDLEPGQCVALVGESGSGKSVTARSLVGLNGSSARIRADALQFGGRDLLALDEHQWRAIRGRSIGYILQDALVSLDPLRTIGQELEEAIWATGGTPAGSIHARAIELLASAQVPDPQTRYHDYPAQLSGGLRQRALIATAMAGRPPVLIADEPTTALDVSVQQEILALFASLKRQGIALILISHDLGVVASLADQVLVLQNGRVVETGPTHRVLSRPSHPYTRTLMDAVPHFGAGQSTAAVPVSANEDAPILKAVGVSKHFIRHGSTSTPREVLKGVSIALRQGQTLGLVGESGSGKTTLARIIAGLEAPSAGEVHSPGFAAGLASHRARPIQFVHQDPLSAYDPRYTVGRIIGEALWMRFGREDRRRRQQRIDEWLTRVGLDPALAARRPLTLSGGQRQRVSIARALATEPRLVVLDEPVSALDVSVQKQILDLIVSLQRETGVAFLFISHDLGVIQRVSHEVAVLRHGELREYGDARSVLETPRDEYTRQLIAAIPTLDFALEQDAGA